MIADVSPIKKLIAKLSIYLQDGQYLLSSATLVEHTSNGYATDEFFAFMKEYIAWTKSVSAAIAEYLGPTNHYIHQFMSAGGTDFVKDPKTKINQIDSVQKHLDVLDSIISKLEDKPDLIYSRSDAKNVADTTELANNPVKIDPRDIFLKPESYVKRTGILHLTPTCQVSIPPPGKGVKYDSGKTRPQCELMRIVFRRVKPMQLGTDFRHFTTVINGKSVHLSRLQIKSLVAEINGKVEAVSGIKKLIILQEKNVKINNSYL